MRVSEVAPDRTVWGIYHSGGDSHDPFVFGPFPQKEAADKVCESADCGCEPKVVEIALPHGIHLLLDLTAVIMYVDSDEEGPGVSPFNRSEPVH